MKAAHIAQWWGRAADEGKEGAVEGGTSGRAGAWKREGKCACAEILSARREEGGGRAASPLAVKYKQRGEG